MRLSGSGTEERIQRPQKAAGARAGPPLEDRPSLAREAHDLRLPGTSKMLRKGRCPLPDDHGQPRKLCAVRAAGLEDRNLVHHSRRRRRPYRPLVGHQACRPPWRSGQDLRLCPLRCRRLHDLEKHRAPAGMAIHIRRNWPGALTTGPLQISAMRFEGCAREPGPRRSRRGVSQAGARRFGRYLKQRRSGGRPDARGGGAPI